MLAYVGKIIWWAKENFMNQLKDDLQWEMINDFKYINLFTELFSFWRLDDSVNLEHKYKTSLLQTLHATANPHTTPSPNWDLNPILL